MDLNNKTVLITGASSGIGQATAIEFAKQKSHLILLYNQNKAGVEKTKSLASQFTSNITVIQADLTQTEHIKKAFDQIQKLDIVINNAGGTDWSSNPLDLNTWKSTFQLDLFSIVQICDLALPLIKDSGKIINISSIYGDDRIGSTDAMAYSAAKAAVNSLTRTLAKHLAPRILVNAIAPGYVLTPIWGELTQEDQVRLGKEQLIERFIKSQEIAEAVIFVAKNDAMCGEVLEIDGGLSLKTVQ